MNVYMHIYYINKLLYHHIVNRGYLCSLSLSVYNIIRHMTVIRETFLIINIAETGLVAKATALKENRSHSLSLSVYICTFKPIRL